MDFNGIQSEKKSYQQEIQNLKDHNNILQQ